MGNGIDHRLMEALERRFALGQLETAALRTVGRWKEGRLGSDVVDAE